MTTDQNTARPTTGTERRKHPRSAFNRPVAVESGGRKGWMVAANISVAGASCRSEVRYPLNTKMTVSIALAGGRGDRTSEPIDLYAVVVRCEPESRIQGTWNVALQFPFADPRVLERLARYLRTELSS